MTTAIVCVIMICLFPHLRDADAQTSFRETYILLRRQNKNKTEYSIVSLILS